MTDQNSKPTLRQKFEKLPERVRVWLTSEEATAIVIDLNSKVGVDEAFISVIPRAITRLITKDLPPQEFAEEISNGLSVDARTTQNIVQEIERRILRPIEIPLRNEAGVDIKMIYAGIQAAESKPIPPLAPTAPNIYRPATPVPPIYPPAPSAGSGQVPPAPPVPPVPTKPSTPKEFPVKINIQKPTTEPLRPTQGEQPFGADSWVNKIK